MSDNLRVEQTNDGSPTLYSSKFSAHYHSTHGALQESNHVFIQEGLSYWTSKHNHKTARILEFGIGTGLNVLLTLEYATARNLAIEYHGVEGYPVGNEVINQLHFKGVNQEDLIRFHELAWNELIQWKDHFQLYKEDKLFEDVHLDSDCDIVYYDAFAPSSQPQLWDEGVLEKVVKALVPGGILVTFCAKGSFKRALKNLGMAVEGIPGPPGKREMTRATKI